MSARTVSPCSSQSGRHGESILCASRGTPSSARKSKNRTQLGDAQQGFQKSSGWNQIFCLGMPRDPCGHIAVSVSTMRNL